MNEIKGTATVHPASSSPATLDDLLAFIGPENVGRLLAAERARIADRLRRLAGIYRDAPCEKNDYLAAECDRIATDLLAGTL